MSADVSRGLSGQDIRTGLRSARFYPAATLLGSANLFARARTAGDLVLVSSATPVTDHGTELTGVIGLDISIETGILAAKWCAANSLVALAEELDRHGDVSFGPLDVLVFCRTLPGFGDQSIIADGASELLGEIFPMAQGHARAAIGAASLVRGSAVVLKASYARSEWNYSNLKAELS